MKTLLNRRNRKWLYVVAVAVIPLLVAYGLVSKEAAPLWLDLIAALFLMAAPATALGHLTPDKESNEYSGPSEEEA